MKISNSSLLAHFQNATGVCTDTRKIQKGNMFFALKGPNFNGNAFAIAALEAGASYAIVDEAIADSAAYPDRIILVDDVLNSGRTLAYGLGVFLNIPLKKLRSVVLVNRSHKNFPVATDFVGLELSTVLKEHVSVVLDENNQEDAVYLV